MRAAFTVTGCLLVVASVSCITLLALAPDSIISQVLERALSCVGTSIVRQTSQTAAGERSPSVPESTDATEAAPPVAAITRVQIPRIRLDADVVTSRLVQLDGGTTWEVPAFKVGHAQYTAGAGEVGNSVLLGHVSSLNAGNVFAELDRVRMGDVVRIFSGAQKFDYVVSDVRSVSRTDPSPLAPIESVSVSLITCTGAWLPSSHDFAQRLVVRAELGRSSDVADAPP